MGQLKDKMQAAMSRVKGAAANASARVRRGARGAASSVRSAAASTRGTLASTRGYSMAEVLATVAIIVILCGIVAMNVVSLQANLRQKALDAKAEIIYTAAQEQMTRIMASGREGVFAAPADNSAGPTGSGVNLVPSTPGDAPFDTETREYLIDVDRLCYITSDQLASDTSATYALFGQGGLDDELAAEHWVIEYDCKTLTVYSVYYSEGGYNCAGSEGYAAADTSTTNPYIGILRAWSYRLDSEKYIGSGNHVGYHTGAGGSAQSSQMLTPAVEVTNGEKLVATATCSKPLDAEDLAFVVTLGDESGHSFTFCVLSSKDYNDSTVRAYVQGLYDNVYGAYLDQNIYVDDLPGVTYKQLNYQNYQLTIVLDSLESYPNSKDSSKSDGLRFTNLYGSGTTTASNYTSLSRNASTALVEGDDITVTVDAFCPRNAVFESAGADSKTVNSLFADGSTSSQARITMGRHLQNLDSSSGIDKRSTKITSAELAADIDFTKSSLDGDDLSCWLDMYEGSYYNGTTSSTPNFEPIANGSLTSFSSASINTIAKLNAVNESGSAGLFESFGDGGITGIILTGTSVKGATVGGLVGSHTSGSLTINNCQLYLDTTRDINGIKKADVLDRSASFLKSSGACGGLVGSASADFAITNSFAATVASGSTVGGLVGTVTGGAASIEASYADSYLVGTTAGGLVGTRSSGTLTAQYCYSAGYLSATTSAAGFVNSTADVNDSYTLCTTLVADGSASRSSVDAYYYTAPGLSASNNVFYLSTHIDAKGIPNSSLGTPFCDPDTDGKVNSSLTLSQLCDTLNGGSGPFTTVTSTTYAYKIVKDPGAFTWPRLSSLQHHGDWERSFQEGALVYYEEYGIKTGTDSSGTRKYARPGLFRLQGGSAENVELLTGSKLTEADVAAFGISKDYVGKEIAVVGDGYGVVYKEGSTYATSAKVEKPSSASANAAWNELGTYSLGSAIKIKGSNYVVCPLDNSINNTATVSPLFYLRATVANKCYLFNPHFAATVIDCDSNATVSEAIAKQYSDLKNISVRSARQLYNMSLYYSVSNGYCKITRGDTFTQDFNITYSAYRWGNYYESGSTIKSQQPIGLTEATAFNGTYDGRYHDITDVSFVTPADENSNKSYSVAGMFGWVDGGKNSTATIKNLVICTDYTPPSSSATGSTGQENQNTQPAEGEDIKVLKGNYYVQYLGQVGSNEEIHMGVLAGYNRGTIENCATAGYFLAGSDGTVHAYANSAIHLGGMVGTNEGRIYNSSADSPRLRLSLYQAKTYAGGFVGSNASGSTVSNCYALGAIECVYAEGGSTDLGGFAGANEGAIQNSYCATAISVSGTSPQSYGFSPKGAGQVLNCTYLNGGSFSYVGRMYAFAFEAGATTEGYPVTYKSMKVDEDASGAVTAANSFMHGVTQTDGRFPYRAVVKNEKGEYVHYGNWQDDIKLGSLGIFYWEHEEGGGNDGYHMTYLGNYEDTTLAESDPNRQTIQALSTLCNSHDDGGVITEYGYGFYVDKGQIEFLTNVNWNAIACSSDDASAKDVIASSRYNTVASEQLQSQLVGAISGTSSAGQQEGTFVFCAFTTSTDTTKNDYLYLDGGTGTSAQQNGTLALTFNTTGDTTKNIVYTFTISPFFGNAMSIDSISSDTSVPVESADGRVTDFNGASAKVGMDDHKYEIRSVQQLQYINWRAGESGTPGATSDFVDPSNYKSFPYLQYATVTDVGVQKKDDVDENRACSFLQTHDIQQTDEASNFTPIAGAGTSTPAREGEGGYKAVLYAWFGGAYNGQSYTIKDVSLRSNSFTVGIFGTTVGADMRNIIMACSEGKTAVIARGKLPDDASDPTGAYALGGLIGVAYDYGVGDENYKPTNSIENCAISGYTVEDNSTNQLGLGEANVGGLVGVANTDLLQCSSTATIKLNSLHAKGTAEYGIYIRVGGLVSAGRF